VVTGLMPVVANDVVRAANDKQQIALTLDKLAALGAVQGVPETLPADRGYYSKANVDACAKARITPLIAPGRERLHPPGKSVSRPRRRCRRLRLHCRRWCTDWPRPKVGKPVPCANRPLNRCPVSSGR